MPGSPGGGGPSRCTGRCATAPISSRRSAVFQMMTGGCWKSSVPGPILDRSPFQAPLGSTKDRAMKSTDLVDNQSLRTDIPQFGPGDEVKVHVKVIEGNKERVQIFQGNVIAISGSGIAETYKVRKVSYGVGVERTFPLHTPTVAKVEVVRRGDVRRAKLYYLRERSGKSAKIKEKRDR